MKMTIDRLKLIAAIKARQAEIDDQRRKEKEELEKSRKKFLKDYIADTKEHLADVEAGRYDPRSGPQWKASRHYWPQSYNSATKDFSYLIQQLELSEDKTLTLDDKSDYFEFLRK